MALFETFRMTFCRWGLAPFGARRACARRLSALGLGSLLLVACSTASNPVSDQTPATADAQTSGLNRVIDQRIESRGAQVPVTLTLPNAALSTAPAPLVVMLHGHGGSRHEAGGFTQVADRLADKGIASIRMDFPGCGDSDEPFRNQRLSTMLIDAKAALAWAMSTASIDPNRLGVFGFSMGGRLAITLAEQDPRLAVMGLWAPSVDPGATALYDFFGGQSNFEAMQASALRDGWVPFTTQWGQAQELSRGWFDDMQRSTPLTWVAGFSGDLFVLYGDGDTVVLPEEAERVLSHATNARTVQRHIVRGADHGLGLFTDEPHLTQEAVQRTTDFFAAELAPEV